MFQKARHPALPQRPHIHALRALAQASALLAALTVFGAAPASAGTNGDIARIENGLRPVVALAGAPVVTKTLAEEMQRLHVPGVSVAVIRDGKIAWAKGFGVAYANGPAVTPKTLFQAASISKPVTALATLRMVESGELSLDADINTLLKDWKLPAADGSNATVTVRQLLSHTAGTSVSGFPAMPPASRYRRCARCSMAPRPRTRSRCASTARQAPTSAIPAAATRCCSRR
ncbi:beta-lactamase family protein [Massilia sp. Dwa41.01b]|uniref:serine hydrolase domain-containing protein n=1 Tax=Massilia sp. Dwa41.01b TaxID=2709302 RepID=UPI001603B761|nr:serine hydrolase domain-containing protein [Massilia sp. Dwa41.01b]QNA90268.1 beta-lactamase family protein [Massilia sp. Dwa41.01b]